MQLPDNIQNILAYGQGYSDGMTDGHICGFHDALVGAVHDLTALLQKYHELEIEYAGLQEKARKERLENMPQLEQPPEQKQGRWIPLGDKTAKCSCCGWWQHTKTYCLPDDIDEFSKCYRFCTACGAVMGEVGEDV